MAAKNKSNELHLTRIYDAPVKMVCDAYTDPKQKAHWWGPRGFTITTHSFKVETGGFWKYTMHGPDGTDYPNLAKYLEVEKYKRLVYDHGGTEDTPPLFRVTVLFSDQNGKTKMDMTMTLPSPEAAEETRKFIRKAGGESTWDRLAEYLQKETSAKEIFVINRSFAAPIDLVFKMWTDPDHLSQWLSPSGTDMKILRGEIKPGGQAFYTMWGPDYRFYGRIRYLEIQSPNRLVYTQQFCDEDEKTSRHPLAPTWPESMLTTVTFTRENDQQTRITVTWEPHGSYTGEELQTFIKARSGMTHGWTGSFDKLESYLEKSKSA